LKAVLAMKPNRFSGLVCYGIERSLLESRVDKERFDRLIYFASASRLTLFRLLFAAVLGVFPTAGSCETGTGSAATFVISQRHIVQGAQTIHLNAHGLRIDGTASGVSILTSAPKWDIYVCDFKRKLAYKTTVTSYKNELLQTLEAFSEESPRKVEMERVGARREFLNTPCFDWRSTTRFENEARGLRKEGLVLGSFPVKVEMAVLDKGVSPAEAEIVSRFYGMPVVQGFPLRSQVTALDHKVRVELESDAISTEHTPDSFFVIPSDFVITSKDKFLARVVNAYQLLHNNR
jgi:hypothetical protein